MIELLRSMSEEGVNVLHNEIGGWTADNGGRNPRTYSSLC